MSTPRKVFKKAQRNVNTRTEGLMKKAAALRDLGARVVVFIEMGGESAMFKSHEDVAVRDYGACMYGPDHFKYAEGEPRSPPITTASRQITQTTFSGEASHAASKPRRAIEPRPLKSPFFPPTPISGKAIEPPSSWFD